MRSCRAIFLAFAALLAVLPAAPVNADGSLQGGGSGCIFSSLFSASGASPHATQRRRLQQSNCGLQFQNQALSFAACKSLSSELGTDANMLWSVAPGEGGNTTFRGAIDAAAAAGSVDWAAMGFNSQPEMPGGSAIVVKTCSSCPTGAAIEGYYLPSYDGVQPGAHFAIRNSSAALSNGRLQGVFELSLALPGGLSSVPVLHAAGPLTSSGDLRQHRYEFAETIDLSTGAAGAPGQAPAPSAAASPPASAVTTAGGAVSPSAAAVAPAPAGGGCVLEYAGNGSRLEFAQCQHITTSSSASSGLRLLWTLSPSPSGNDSVLTGALACTAANSWAGWGLAPQPDQMLGTTAIIMKPCASCPTGASVDHYLLSSYDPSGIKPGTGNLTLSDTAAAQRNGQLHALFTVTMPRGISEMAQTPSNIIASVGPVDASGGLQSHPVSNAFSGVVNFAAGTATVQQSSGGGPSDQLVTAHAVLTIVGWGLLLPLGVIFARFKEMGPAWFQLHRAMQAFGWAVGVAGAGIGFALGEPNGTELEGHHRSIGIAVLALLSLQVLLAAFWRPQNKPTRLRASWNVGHWTIGGVGLALAISNVFIGLQVGGERALWSGLYAIGIGLILLVWAGKLTLDCGRRPPGKAYKKGTAALVNRDARAELGMAEAPPQPAANSHGAARY